MTREYNEGDIVQVLPIKKASLREDEDDYSSAFWQECAGKQMTIESMQQDFCIAHLNDGVQKRYVLYESDINQTRPRY